MSFKFGPPRKAAAWEKQGAQPSGREDASVDGDGKCMLDAGRIFPCMVQGPVGVAERAGRQVVAGQYLLSTAQRGYFERHPGAAMTALFKGAIR